MGVEALVHVNTYDGRTVDGGWSALPISSLGDGRSLVIVLADLQRSSWRSNQGSDVDYALNRNFPKDTPILPPDRVRQVVAAGYLVSGGYKYPCDIIESEDAGAITMNETNQHLSTGLWIFSEGAQV